VQFTKAYWRVQINLRSYNFVNRYGSGQIHGLAVFISEERAPGVHGSREVPRAGMDPLKMRHVCGVFLKWLIIPFLVANVYGALIV